MLDEKIIFSAQITLTWHKLFTLYNFGRNL